MCFNSRTEASLASYEGPIPFILLFRKTFKDVQHAPMRIIVVHLDNIGYAASPQMHIK